MKATALSLLSCIFVLLFSRALILYKFSFFPLSELFHLSFVRKAIVSWKKKKQCKFFLSLLTPQNHWNILFSSENDCVFDSLNSITEQICWLSLLVTSLPPSDFHRHLRLLNRHVVAKTRNTETKPPKRPKRNDRIKRNGRNDETKPLTRSNKRKSENR